MVVNLTSASVLTTPNALFFSSHVCTSSLFIMDQDIKIVPSGTSDGQTDAPVTLVDVHAKILSVYARID